jgi:hypothetical protein
MNRTIKQPLTGGESRAVLALREYLQAASPEELDADWHKVEGMGLQGPTFSELMQQQRALASYLPLAFGAYNA